MQSSHQRLPSKFLGRGSGRLTKQPSSYITVLLDGTSLVQRCGFRKKQQCICWLRELAHELGSHAVLHASSYQLWQKILASKGLGMPFPQWLLRQDIVQSVPCALPSKAWIDKVVSALLLEEQHWCKFVRNQRNQACRETMTEDFHTRGRLHASHLRGEAAAPLVSLPQRELLHVVPLRCRKSQPAKFRLAVDSPAPW